MTMKELQLGSLVRVTANGGTHDLYVREVKDGRVTLRRSPTSARGGWWLPVEFLLAHGEVPHKPAKRERMPTQCSCGMYGRAWAAKIGHDCALSDFAYRYGRRAQSERTKAILARLHAGDLQENIAREFNCTHQNISDIKRRAERRQQSSTPPSLLVRE